MLTSVGREVAASDFHLHNLLIQGIAVRGERAEYDDVRQPGRVRYRRFNFTLDGARYDTHQEAAAKTPYGYSTHGLTYRGTPLTDLPFRRIEGAEDTWGCEGSWYLKCLRDQDRAYELRLNPVNACANLRFRTGRSGQFRGCAFCHRVYHAGRSSEHRTITPIDQVFADLFDVEGRELIPAVQKVLMITGDTKDPEQLIAIAESAYRDHLVPNGFDGTFSLATHLVRTDGQMRRVAALDDQLYEFPLECFTRRAELLGPIKGMPLEEALEILRRARRYFRHTRINLIIGVEPLRSLEAGLIRLMAEGLIDDVIANVLGPYTPAMKTLRVDGADDVEFVFAAREIMERLRAVSKRSGVTKSAFHDDRHARSGGDSLIRNRSSRCQPSSRAE